MGGLAGGVGAGWAAHQATGGSMLAAAGAAVIGGFAGSKLEDKVKGKKDK